MTLSRTTYRLGVPLAPLTAMMVLAAVPRANGSVEARGGSALPDAVRGNVSLVAVPEPASLVMAGAAVVCLALGRRRSRRGG